MNEQMRGPHARACLPLQPCSSRVLALPDPLLPAVCQVSILGWSGALGDIHCSSRITDELGPPRFLEQLQGCTSAL